MKKLHALILHVVLCFASQGILMAQQLAFPGAEGAGRFTSGGRGVAGSPTTVFKVTSLSDVNTPGTLRYAVSASGATFQHRTIVFDVAGTIHLSSPLVIRSNTSIAGFLSICRYGTLER